MWRRSQLGFSRTAYSNCFSAIPPHLRCLERPWNNQSKNLLRELVQPVHKTRRYCRGGRCYFREMPHILKPFLLNVQNSKTSSLLPLQVLQLLRRKLRSPLHFHQLMCGSAQPQGLRSLPLSFLRKLFVSLSDRPLRDRGSGLNLKEHLEKADHRVLLHSSRPCK